MSWQDILHKKRKLTSKPSSESSLRDWFGRKGAKGSKGGWVDCNAPDGKGGYKSCGRSSGEKEKDILLVALPHQPVKLKVKVRNGGRQNNVADYFEKRPQKRNGQKTKKLR